MHHGYRISGPFHNGSFIGTYKAVCRGVGKGAAQQSVAEALRRLRQHHILARNGGSNQGTVGGPLHLFDRVHGRQSHNGGAVLNYRINGAIDGGNVNQRPHRVVHQHDIVCLSGQSCKGVGDRLLAIVATLDHVHPLGKAVFGNLCLDALHLCVAYGHVDCRHSLNSRESAQGMDEDRHSIERQKLLGLGPGHPGAQSGRGKNHKYLHNSWSIHRRARRAAARMHDDTRQSVALPAYHFEMRHALPPKPPAKPAAALRLDMSLLKPGLRLAVGLSGGADSVALLRALAARSAELGLIVHAAHLHHGLRGEEADADLAFARALAATLNLTFHEAQVDVAAEAQANPATGKPAETIEEAARRLRYAWFRQILASGEVDAIATAHTLDDQAETVLAKFLRGAWTEGLSGIHPRLESPEGAILRPLLATTRAEIEAYLGELGQDWREDSSNRHLTFTRNRIRHELLPLLEGWNPRLREHLAQMAELARDEEAWWQTELARLAPQILLPGKPVRGGGRAAGDGALSLSIEVTRLSAFAPALQRRLLRFAAAQLGAAPDFPATEALLEMALAGRAGQKLELAQGLRAERSHRELRLAAGLPSQDEKASPPPEYKGTIPGEMDAPAFGLHLKIGFSPSKSSPQGQGTSAGQTVTLRNWRPGDRVTLRHSSGPRKVKEVLERIRVTGTSRTLWPVLELDGRIVWMQGVELDAGQEIAVEVTLLGAAAEQATPPAASRPD